MARFIDAEGRERWVTVKVEDNVEVRESSRKVVFIHELRRVEVSETANPGNLPDILGLAKLELDGILEKKRGKLSIFTASYRLKCALSLSTREEAEEIIRALADTTGEYAFVGSDIVQL